MVLPNDDMLSRRWADLGFLSTVLEPRREQFERSSQGDFDRVHRVLLLAALIRATASDLIAAIGKDDAHRTAALDDLQKVRVMLEGADDTVTQLTKGIEHLTNLILFDKTDADRLAIVQ